jgi:hypothetical protein
MKKIFSPMCVADQADAKVAVLWRLGLSDSSLMSKATDTPKRRDFISVLVANYWSPFFSRFISSWFWRQMLPTSERANVLHGCNADAVAFSQRGLALSALSYFSHLVCGQLGLAVGLSGMSLRHVTIIQGQS